MRVLAILGLLLAAGAAQAVPVKMYKEQAPATPPINGLAINSTRYTGWIGVPTSRSIAFVIDFTHSAATAVTMSCETQDDASTANGSGHDIHILSSSGATSTSAPHVWSNAVSGDESWTWTLANLPESYVNCWFDGTSADGSDTIIVSHRRITP